MSKEQESKAWKAAPEVKELADRLIKVVNEHQHLNFCNVVYLFNRVVDKVRGAEALATASKVTGRNAYFLIAGVDSSEFIEPEACFVISVWEEGWEQLTDKQREALIDHELCHCKVIEDDDGTGRLFIKPHDIEEFHSIAKRHGDWRPDITSFVRDVQAGQGRLRLEDAG